MQVEIRVQEAATQQPLIWQSRRSFVHQFDWTLAAYSGCQMGCTYCYLPDVLWNLPDKLGGGEGMLMSALAVLSC